MKKLVLFTLLCANFCSQGMENQKLLKIGSVNNLHNKSDHFDKRYKVRGSRNHFGNDIQAIVRIYRSIDPKYPNLDEKQFDTIESFRKKYKENDLTEYQFDYLNDYNKKAMRKIKNEEKKFSSPKAWFAYLTKSPFLKATALFGVTAGAVKYGYNNNINPFIIPTFSAFGVIAGIGGLTHAAFNTYMHKKSFSYAIKEMTRHADYYNPKMSAKAFNAKYFTDKNAIK